MRPCDIELALELCKEVRLLSHVSLHFPMAVYPRVKAFEASRYVEKACMK